MAARTKFEDGFSGTVEKILSHEQDGHKRSQIEEILGVSRTMLSKSVRLYLTSKGRTPDSGNLEVRNKAVELVKKLDADEISVHNADEILIECIKQVKGKTTYRKAVTPANPHLQLAGYRRAVGTLEGICYAIDKMPEVIHSSITKEQREEIETRLASCRRIIEQRINIIRRDGNAEA